MRLLITTQTLDLRDPVLGFFHEWVRALAGRFDHVTVIALAVGEHALPPNVTVRSLGKERGVRGSLTYAARFLRHLTEIAGTYDAIFVHMNPEYVFLGRSFWQGKRVALWYNHEHGGWKLALASGLVDRIFHTSPHAASARYPVSRQMPAGIDTDVFRAQDRLPEERSIYFQGRIAESKRVHVLLAALRHLPDATLTLVGPADEAYLGRLRQKYGDLFASGRVVLRGPVPNRATPELYAAHAVSVNLTAAGNFDKTVLESIACGTPAVVSSPAFSGLVPEACFFAEGDSESLAAVLAAVLALSHDERRSLIADAAQAVEERHSLRALVATIASDYDAS